MFILDSMCSLLLLYFSVRWALLDGVIFTVFLISESVMFRSSSLFTLTMFSYGLIAENLGEKREENRGVLESCQRCRNPSLKQPENARKIQKMGCNPLEVWRQKKERKHDLCPCLVLFIIMNLILKKSNIFHTTVSACGSNIYILLTLTLTVFILEVLGTIYPMPRDLRVVPP